jgi:hypothetical protein
MIVPGVRGVLTIQKIKERDCIIVFIFVNLELSNVYLSVAIQLDCFNNRRLLSARTWTTELNQKFVEGNRQFFCKHKLIMECFVNISFLSFRFILNFISFL